MENLLKIIQALYTKTKQREINWEQTNIRNQFAIKLGEGRVCIDYFDEYDLNGSDECLPIYRVTFYNKNNDDIGRCEAEYTDSESYELLNNLWLEINDSFYRKKETIRSMLDDLGLA